jgi:hypothetical protein
VKSVGKRIVELEEQSEQLDGEILAKTLAGQALDPKEKRTASLFGRIPLRNTASFT